MFELKFWVLLVAVVAGVAVSEKNVVCYYGSWATYRWSTGKFDVSDINTDLCTHLIYAFAGMERGAIVALDPYLDLPDNWGRNNYGAFTALKEKNAKLKTILAVGGWNEGSAKYSVMAYTAASRKVFIDSAVAIIRTHGFDGLDLDWEYPNRRDTVHGADDVENFTLLVKELREEFDKHGWFLSSAVSSVRAMAALSYNIPEISKYLDMINIMTYDMYGAWDSVTGHNAPLHKGIGDVGDPADLFTVDVALQYWISQGAPVEKIALGVPFYGRTFTLSDANATSVRDPASGPGISGTYTGTNGLIGYNEFCYKLLTETWSLDYDSLAKVPYAHSGHNWISYDDENSITKKVEFAKSLGVISIMIWSIETDDFHGLCGDRNWPLLRAINTALVDENPVSPTTVPSTVAPSTDSSTVSSTNTTSTTAATTVSTSTATTVSTTFTTESTTVSIPTSVPSTSSSTTVSGSTGTTPRPTNPICTESGMVPNPTECTSFYICVYSGSSGLVPVKLLCPVPLHWDQTNNICNYPHLANCNV